MITTKFSMAHGTDKDFDREEKFAYKTQWQ